MGVAHSPTIAGGSERIPFASPRVEPAATALFAHLARTGETFPTYKRSAQFERTGKLPVVVRFVSTPNEQGLGALRAKGVVFDRATPIASGAWLASVDQKALQALGNDPNVARVSVDLMHRVKRPLDQSAIETGAIIAKRASIAKNGVRLDGKGTLIADIDSPVFMHHPDFFRADGGAFAWVDVNKNGSLTPDIDGIDLNGNGTIEPNEVLHDLQSVALSVTTGETINDHSDFDPAIDYLYLDTNGNGVRDYGTKKFKEDTPAFGEPLFVFDDVNHDGLTQPTERLLQLKTSKFKEISSQDKNYTRGAAGAAGLLAYDPEDDADLGPQMMHATGVTGILVGGVPGISKWVGLAPEAELVLNDGTTSRGLVSAVQWAIDLKPDVILTEYAPYTDVSLDGSSEDETILDAANDKGIVTVSPAGNLATGKKHRTVTLQPGVQTINLATDQPGRLASISTHYKGPARTVTFALTRPDGTVVAIPADSTPNGTPLPDGAYLYVMAQTTPRGTNEKFIDVYADSALKIGSYVLSITLDAGAPVEMELFAGDDVTSWAYGFTFDQDTPTHTICSPSTSDKTISVAAYVLHDEPDYYPAGKKGDLAYYSSRGTNLDGSPGIEIAAPDNPLTAFPPPLTNATPNTALWSPFGGTSGAGPHVTAAAVLIKQAFPTLAGADIKKKILDSARPWDGDTQPEASVGKGKLDIAKAIGATIASGAAPIVKLDVVTPLSQGVDGKLKVSATDDEAQTALTARWDLDYDGTFDTDWVALGEQVIPVKDAANGSKIGVKVEVRDGEGNINGMTSILDVGAALDADDAGADGSAIAATATATTTTGCACGVIAASRDLSNKARGSMIASFALGLLAFVRRGRRRRRRRTRA